MYLFYILILVALIIMAIIVLPLLSKIRTEVEIIAAVK